MNAEIPKTVLDEKWRTPKSELRYFDLGNRIALSICIKPESGATQYRFAYREIIEEHSSEVEAFKELLRKTLDRLDFMLKDSGYLTTGGRDQLKRAFEKVNWRN